MSVKYRDSLSYSLSRQQCKIEQILKWIQSYTSSSTLEIDLSLIRENSYLQKKIYWSAKFNIREKFVHVRYLIIF